MNVFYSDSKTDLKLRCDYCIKFQLFEGDQEVSSRLMALCCMLLTYTLLQITAALQEACRWALMQL